MSKHSRLASGHPAEPVLRSALVGEEEIQELRHQVVRDRIADGFLILPSASASPTSVEVNDFAIDQDVNVDLSLAPLK